MTSTSIYRVSMMVYHGKPHNYKMYEHTIHDIC